MHGTARAKALSVTCSVSTTSTFDSTPGAALPRQTDPLATRGAATYLIECKWRTDKANVDDLGALRARLRRTDRSTSAFSSASPGSPAASCPRSAITAASQSYRSPARRLRPWSRALWSCPISARGNRRPARRRRGTAGRAFTCTDPPPTQSRGASFRPQVHSAARRRPHSISRLEHIHTGSGSVSLSTC